MSVHFAIPVLVDSPERERNLRNLLAHLPGTHRGRITVVEQFEERPVLAGWGCEHMSLRKPNDYFYRAELLNLVFRESIDDVVVIWEVDAVLMPEAVEWAIREVEEGRLDLAFPHNRRVKTVDPAGYAGGDLYAFLRGKPKSWLCSNSCGLCQVMRRQAWLEAGMENENIVSWGCDDRERLSRWIRIELRIGFSPVERCYGLHQHHPDSKFSRVRHGRSAQNYREYKTSLSSSGESLRRRIAEWPWTRPEKNFSESFYNPVRQCYNMC